MFSFTGNIIPVFSYNKDRRDKGGTKEWESRVRSC